MTTTLAFQHTVSK